jgi:flagellar biosynthesis protein FliP
MNDDAASDYTLWVKLANDPSQTEEARQQYRALMEAHVHRKLREAFQFAVESTAPKVP